MDGKELSNFDQAAAQLADSLPPMWRRLYDNCQLSGFTPEQSWTLLTVYIFSTGGGDKYPPKGA